jgi:cytochrome b561
MGPINMSDEQQIERYSGLAKVFHWVIVALVAAQFVIAWTMPEIGRGSRPEGLIGWHLSVGAAIFVIAIARLAWRTTHLPPRAPRDIAPALQTLSRVTHALLYLLLLVLPLMGWANASARGWALKLFGVIPLPSLVPTGSAFGRQMGDVHGTTAIVFLAVIAFHVCGAGYHAFVLRDRTLQRML